MRMIADTALKKKKKKEKKTDLKTRKTLLQTNPSNQ
jgi:hypothetical protein